MTTMPAIHVKPAALVIEEYFARIGSHFTNRDAQIIGPELVKLAKQGRSTADDIKEAARPEDAPFHPYFEWDDSEAAEQFRSQQARNLAGSIMVRISDERGEKHEVRAFHAVEVVYEEDEEKPTLKDYVSFEIVRGNEDLSRQVIKDAIQALVGWRKRYTIYAHIFGVAQAAAHVDKAIDSLQLETGEMG